MTTAIRKHTDNCGRTGAAYCASCDLTCKCWCHWKLCVVCERQLLPQTHVPRDPRFCKENPERYAAEQEFAANQRKLEIAEGRVGYLGEGQFCNQSCASFLARGLMEASRNTDSKHSTAYLMRLAIKLAQSYAFIVHRMKTK